MSWNALYTIIQRPLRGLHSLFGNINEDALSSKAPKNPQNGFEIGCEQISFDSAQMAAFHVSRLCQLYFSSALSESQ